MRLFLICWVCAGLSVLFLTAAFKRDVSSETISMRTSIAAEKPIGHSNSNYKEKADAHNIADQVFNGKGEIVGDIPPCSEVNTMPCTAVAPDDPVREQLEENSKSGVFKKGQKVTCIYKAVAYEWHDKTNQIVKGVGAKCLVTDASPVWNDIEPGYQHVKVDCEKDLRGQDNIADNDLNKGERWMFSDNCYHF